MFAYNQKDILSISKGVRVHQNIHTCVRSHIQTDIHDNNISTHTRLYAYKIRFDMHTCQPRYMQTHMHENIIHTLIAIHETCLHT